MKMSRVAASMPFAHLLGFAKAEDDEEARKAKRADDDDGEGDEEARKAKRAEDGDDGDEEGKKSRKAKKAKKAADDGDDGDEEDDSKAKSAVRRDRARCASIVAHGIKAGRVRQACVMAFDTELSARAAIASIDASIEDAAKPRNADLSSRMAAADVPRVGSEAGAAAPAGMSPVAAAIIAAGEKARSPAK